MKHQTWTDETTMLTWEIKTPENVKNSYTQYEAFKYAEELNEQNFGGYSDWRLPKIEELESILTEEENNNFFIKKELSEVCSSYYWSSTTNENYKDVAWVMVFGNGYVLDDNKDYNFYVRCVRAGQ
jgi:hypothetical protein